MVRVLVFMRLYVEGFGIVVVRLMIGLLNLMV